MSDEPCVVVFAKSGIEVSAPPNAVLLEIAEEQGLPVPSLCRGGSCGTCKLLLRSGQPEIDTAHALTSKEQRAGWILACSARTIAGGRIVVDA